MIKKFIARKREKLVRLHQSLIRISSESDAVHGHERDYQRLVAGYMQQLGLQVDVFEASDIPNLEQHPAFLRQGKQYKGRPTVVGKLPGQGGGPSLMLTAHSDTVVARDFRQWTKDPWGGEILNGKIYGLGAQDNREGTAAMLFALEVLLERGFTPRGDLYLASTIDEESGYGNGMVMLAERGYRPDGVLYLDGCNMVIEIANTGGCDVFLEVIPNKPEARRHLWQAARRVEAISRQLQHERAEMLQSNDLYRDHYIGKYMFQCFAQHSSTLNRPDVNKALKFCLKFNTIIGETESEIKTLIKRRFTEGLAEFDMRLVFNFPNAWFEPSLTPPDAPIVRAVQAAHQTVFNKPGVIGAGSKIDAYVLRNYYGIPVVSCGPAHFMGKGGAHMPDEYLAITKLVKFTELTAQSVLAWQEL
ncbi:MAG: M20 family metallopeptidase [Armatimonadota bacterium]